MPCGKVAPQNRPQHPAEAMLLSVTSVWRSFLLTAPRTVRVDSISFLGWAQVILLYVNIFPNHRRGFFFTAGGIPFPDRLPLAGVAASITPASGFGGSAN